MSLHKLQAALESVGVPVFRYEAEPQDDQYIVWAEDGAAESLRANNLTQAHAVTGTVDYFTRIHDDPITDEIERIFNGLKIAWKLNSVQHETDTGYIHHEWAWEVSKWLG